MIIMMIESPFFDLI